MKRYVVLYLLVLAAPTVLGQEAYRCEPDDGPVLYQAHACPPGVKSRVIKLRSVERVDGGVEDLFDDALFRGDAASIKMQQRAMADTLAQDRRARARSAKVRALQQSLARLSADYRQQRAQLAEAQASLATDPAFRNWQSNPAREAKYQARKQALARQIAALEREYRQSRGRQASALARAEARGGAN